MNFRSLVIFLCATLSLFGCSERATALDQVSEKAVDQVLMSSNPALAMVERFNMGSNLEQMAIQVSKTTHTYAMVAQKHGATNAPSIVAQEVKKLIPSYQPQWNKNLANAYSSHLSQQEIHSIALDGKKSPYADKLRDVQNAVGTDMQKASTQILSELATNALINAVK
jgi:hypothetical protein